MDLRIGLIGKKLGMTRIYDERGRAVAATVIDVTGNSKVQVKDFKKHGYSAVQLAFDDQKEQRLKKPQIGHFKKHGSAPKKITREFRLSDTDVVPEDFQPTPDIFVEGQMVDVIGRSKGKGFQGVIKRHGMAGQPASHGSTMHRRNGAIGNRSTPGRVWKNMGMPGHMGNDQITVQNLRIVQVRVEDQALLVSGAVPGAAGSYVVVRPAIKRPVGTLAKVKIGVASVAKTGAKTAIKKK